MRSEALVGVEGWESLFHRPAPVASLVSADALLAEAWRARMASPSAHMRACMSWRKFCCGPMTEPGRTTRM